MKHVIPTLLIAALALAGCENIFGKGQGERGALPGKRQDVFSEARLLKPAPGTTAQIELPEQQDVPAWTEPGGSPTRVHGHAALSDKPNKAWATSIDSGSSDEAVLAATPVIEDGRIFTIDAHSEVRALSATDGSVLWKAKLPEEKPDEKEPASAGAGAGLAIGNGVLAVTTSHGTLAVLDAASGEVLWERMLLSPIRSAPIIAGEKIYVINMSNVLQEFSLKDGAPGWTHAGIEETASILGMASPVATEELLIVPYSSGELFALRRLNGQMVWQENLAGGTLLGASSLPSMADIQGQPVIDSGRIYAASHSGFLAALDLRTGRRIWESDAGSVQTPWLAGKTLFVFTTENQLVALSALDGKTLWVQSLPRHVDPENRTEAILWAGPVLAGGKLWLGSSQGELRSFDPQNGEELDTLTGFAPIYLAPIVAGRTLYVLDDSGTLMALR